MSISDSETGNYLFDLKFFYFSIFTTLASLILFILCADPYTLFSNTFGKHKLPYSYRMNSYERVIKSNIISTSNINSAIIGTSRSSVGIDPQFLPKNVFGYTYNFGINGAYISEIEQALILSIENGADTIIYGLDFFTFIKNDVNLVDTLISFRSDNTFSRIRYLTYYTFSVDAILDSVYKIYGNIRGIAPSHDEFGHYSNYTPADFPISINRHNSNIALSELNFHIFTRMVQLASANSIKLKIFTSPTYNHHLLKSSIHGLWLEEVRKIAKNSGFEISDFSTDPSFTSQRSDFFDEGHYRPKLGNRILRRIFPDIKFAD